MVEDSRWRSDPRGSNSSVEPSVSSFTNGTHSSLNSEVEEEELAYSIDPRVHSNFHMQLNGHLSGRRTHEWNTYLILVCEEDYSVKSET